MASRDHQEGSCLFTGVGSPQPKSRQLSGGMFVHRPDAFDEKSLKIGHPDPSRIRKVPVEDKPEEIKEEEKQENGTEETEPTPAEPEVKPVAPMPVFEGVS